MARWGRVDALVNNAGVAVFKPALETSFEEWRHVLGTHLDGAFLCTQAFGAIMKAQKNGAIVNIASISGLRASLWAAPMCVAIGAPGLVSILPCVMSGRGLA